MDGAATDVHLVARGYAGEIRFLTGVRRCRKHLTEREVPNAGCAMDGMASDVYYLKGGFEVTIFTIQD